MQSTCTSQLLSAQQLLLWKKYDDSEPLLLWGLSLFSDFFHYFMFFFLSLLLSITTKKPNKTTKCVCLLIYFVRRPHLCDLLLLDSMVQEIAISSKKKRWKKLEILLRKRLLQPILNQTSLLLVGK